MQILELLLAVFAVFGFYMLVRLLLLSHALAHRVILLYLPADTVPEALPGLLEQARAHTALCTERGVVALVCRDASEALLNALREANIPYYKAK